MRVDRERREPLRSQTEERILRSLFAALKGLDALVLSDYDKGLITDEFADRVLERLSSVEGGGVCRTEEVASIRVSRCEGYRL